VATTTSFANLSGSERQLQQSSEATFYNDPGFVENNHLGSLPKGMNVLPNHAEGLTGEGSRLLFLAAGAEKTETPLAPDLLKNCKREDTSKVCENIESNKKERLPVSEGGINMQTESSNTQFNSIASWMIAQPNNNEGMAGASPDANVLFYNTEGASAEGILGAMYYGSGAKQAGVDESQQNVRAPTCEENNPNIRGILVSNLAVSPCSDTLQESINNLVLKENKIIIAPGFGPDYFPANCDNVITVSAADNNGNPTPVETGTSTNTVIYAPGGSDIEGEGVIYLNTDGSFSETSGPPASAAFVASHLMIALQVNPAITHGEFGESMQATAGGPNSNQLDSAAAIDYQKENSPWNGEYNKPNECTGEDTKAGKSNGKDSNVGAIAGGTAGGLAALCVALVASKVKYFDKQPTMRNYNRKLQNLNNQIDKRNKITNERDVQRGLPANESRAIPRQAANVAPGSLIKTAMNGLDQKIKAVKTELKQLDDGKHPIQLDDRAAEEAVMAAAPPGDGAGQAAQLAVIDSNDNSAAVI